MVVLIIFSLPPSLPQRSSSRVASWVASRCHWARPWTCQLAPPSGSQSCGDLRQTASPASCSCASYGTSPPAGFSPSSWQRWSACWHSVEKSWQPCNPSQPAHRWIGQQLLQKWSHPRQKRRLPLRRTALLTLLLMRTATTNGRPPRQQPRQLLGSIYLVWTRSLALQDLRLWCGPAGSRLRC